MLCYVICFHSIIHYIIFYLHCLHVDNTSSARGWRRLFGQLVDDDAKRWRSGTGVPCRGRRLDSVSRRTASSDENTPCCIFLLSISYVTSATTPSCMNQCLTLVHAKLYNRALFANSQQNDHHRQANTQSSKPRLKTVRVLQLNSGHFTIPCVFRISAFCIRTGRRQYSLTEDIYRVAQKSNPLWLIVIKSY